MLHCLYACVYVCVWGEKEGIFIAMMSREHKAFLGWTMAVPYVYVCVSFLSHAAFQVTFSPCWTCEASHETLTYGPVLKSSYPSVGYRAMSTWPRVTLMLTYHLVGPIRSYTHTHTHTHTGGFSKHS